MSAPGFWELVFLAVLALLIFGPDKLPGIARSVGQTLGRFKQEAQTTLDELKRTAEVDELRKVGDDLRSTGRELQAQVSATGPPADGRKRPADEAEPATTRALTRPPFDPDAT